MITQEHAAPESDIWLVAYILLFCSQESATSRIYSIKRFVTERVHCDQGITLPIDDVEFVRIIVDIDCNLGRIESRLLSCVQAHG